MVCLTKKKLLFSFGLIYRSFLCCFLCQIFSRVNKIREKKTDTWLMLRMIEQRIDCMWDFCQFCGHIFNANFVWKPFGNEWIPYHLHRWKNKTNKSVALIYFFDIWYMYIPLSTNPIFNSIFCLHSSKFCYNLLIRRHTHKHMYSQMQQKKTRSSTAKCFVILPQHKNVYVENA